MTPGLLLYAQGDDSGSPSTLYVPSGVLPSAEHLAHLEHVAAELGSQGATKSAGGGPKGGVSLPGGPWSSAIGEFEDLLWLVAYVAKAPSSTNVDIVRKQLLQGVLEAAKNEVESAADDWLARVARRAFAGATEAGALAGAAAHEGVEHEGARAVAAALQIPLAELEAGAHELIEAVDTLANLKSNAASLLQEHKVAWRRIGQLCSPERAERAKMRFCSDGVHAEREHVLKNFVPTMARIGLDLQRPIQRLWEGERDVARLMAGVRQVSGGAEAEADAVEIMAGVVRYAEDRALDTDADVNDPDFKEEQAARALKNFDGLLKAVAEMAYARKEDGSWDDTWQTGRSSLEEILKDLEARGVLISKAVHSVLQGQKDIPTLTVGLDNVDTCMVHRLLEYCAATRSDAPRLGPLRNARTAAALKELAHARRNLHSNAEGFFTVNRPLMLRGARLCSEASAAEGSALCEGGLAAQRQHFLAQHADRWQRHGWQLKAPLQRLWNGERNIDRLLAGIDPNSAVVVRELFKLLAPRDLEAPPSASPSTNPSAPSAPSAPARPSRPAMDEASLVAEIAALAAAGDGAEAEQRREKLQTGALAALEGGALQLPVLLMWQGERSAGPLFEELPQESRARYLMKKVMAAVHSQEHQPNSPVPAVAPVAAFRQHPAVSFPVVGTPPHGFPSMGFSPWGIQAGIQAGWDPSYPRPYGAGLSQWDRMTPSSPATTPPRGTSPPPPLSGESQPTHSVAGHPHNAGISAVDHPQAPAPAQPAGSANSGSERSSKWLTPGDAGEKHPGSSDRDQPRQPVSEDQHTKLKLSALRSADPSAPSKRPEAEPGSNPPPAPPPEHAPKAPAAAPQPGELRMLEPDDLLTVLDAEGKAVLLGEGGSGKVYKAWFAHGNCHVAKKELVASGQASTADVELMMREARLMGQLRHEHLTPVIGVCAVRGHWCICSELMERGDLFKLIKAGDPEVRWAARGQGLALAAARGLKHLHERSPTVVHGDLKSPNIFVNDAWVGKIGDLGASKIKQHTYLSTCHMQVGPSAAARLLWARPIDFHVTKCSLRRAPLARGKVESSMRPIGPSPPDSPCAWSSCIQRVSLSRPLLEEPWGH
ncbi:hypothetical protein CYMTET_30868 [Cymbomonas tetramitiformis]|uniref:Protein kinase domain-containing protein n=1 Tax=Cymbomonas tetramitiformis TaxID=36881 RepID=A0AAE0FIL4_9CHLO|nr:hypothetical protein CYMTET_30868 [Cymbomonas tetramitiformis]